MVLSEHEIARRAAMYTCGYGIKAISQRFRVAGCGIRSAIHTFYGNNPRDRRVIFRTIRDLASTYLNSQGKKFSTAGRTWGRYSENEAHTYIKGFVDLLHLQGIEPEDSMPRLNKLVDGVLKALSPLPRSSWNLEEEVVRQIYLRITFQVPPANQQSSNPGLGTLFRVARMNPSILQSSFHGFGRIFDGATNGITKYLDMKYRNSQHLEAAKVRE